MEEGSELKSSLKVFIGVTMCVLAPLICAGNAITMATIITNKKLHYVTMGLIFNMSLADFLSGVFLCSFTAFIHLWKSGSLLTVKLVCNGTYVLSIMFLGQSLFSNLYLSFERYLAICHPFKHALWVTKERTLVTVIFGWLFCLAVVMTPFITIREWDAAIDECVPRAVYSVAYVMYIYISVFSLIVSNIVLQLLVMREMKKHHRQVQSSVTTDIDIQNRRQEIRKGKLTAMLFLCFVVCWAAYIVASPLNVFVNNRVMPVLREVAFVVGVSNSFINFIIYTANNKELRKPLMKLIKVRTTSKVFANDVQLRVISLEH